VSKFVSPLFYNDAHAQHLLGHGVRIANVYQNGFGDQFFGSAHASRKTADARPPFISRHVNAGPLYRIVVRLKNV
jgi:hypothetical protein